MRFNLRFILMLILVCLYIANAKDVSGETKKEIVKVGNKGSKPSKPKSTTVGKKNLETPAIPVDTIVKKEPIPNTQPISPLPIENSKPKAKFFLPATEVQDVGIALSYNLIETFGRIPSINLKYDYYFLNTSWFAQADLGMGYFYRDAEIPLVHQGLYENDLIVSVDLALGYSFENSKLAYTNGNLLQYNPFVLVGPLLIYQGGSYNPGGLIGIGQILYPKKNLGFNFYYGVKDRIYFPKVYTTRFITHNIQMFLGIQFRVKK